MQRFAGLNVLVTGAASGIGRASALRLAREGAWVLCADLNRAGADETVAMIEDAGIAGAGAACSLDVADTASCEAAVALGIELRGGLDALCNIAGIGDFGHVLDVDDARWHRLIDVNLGGVFAMTRAALPHIEAARGNIVNIASAAGLVGTPYAAAY